MPFIKHFVPHVSQWSTSCDTYVTDGWTYFWTGLPRNTSTLIFWCLPVFDSYADANWPSFLFNSIALLLFSLRHFLLVMTPDFRPTESTNAFTLKKKERFTVVIFRSHQWQLSLIKERPCYFWWNHRFFPVGTGMATYLSMLHYGQWCGCFHKPSSARFLIAN